MIKMFCCWLGPGHLTPNGPISSPDTLPAGLYVIGWRRRRRRRPLPSQEKLAVAVWVGGGGVGFPDFLKIKIIPGGVHSPPGRPRSTSSKRWSALSPSTTHSPSSPRTSRRGRVRKWRICSEADSTNTRVGPNGRGRLPVVPSQPAAKMAAGCLNLPPGSHAPASPPLPGSSDADSRRGLWARGPLRRINEPPCLGLTARIPSTPEHRTFDWGQITR